MRVIALSFIIYHLSFSVALAQDEDKVQMFNPVEYAVISMPVVPLWVTSVRLQTRM